MKLRYVIWILWATHFLLLMSPLYLLWETHSKLTSFLAGMFSSVSAYNLPRAFRNHRERMAFKKMSPEKYQTLLDEKTSFFSEW